MVTPNM